MKQVLKWIPVIILAALVALPAPAQRMGFGPGMGPGWAAGAPCGGFWPGGPGGRRRRLRSA
jgi:hypothetical protein